MSEVTDLSPTDGSNTSFSGEGISGATFMTRTDEVFQVILGALGRWTDYGSIASASTCAIGAEPEAYLNVTGTTTITAFGTIRNGTIRFLKFAGALTLTHNATSLILPGGANITTAAGDTAVFASEGSGNWRCLAYQKASGLPVATPAATPLKGHIFGLTLSNNGTDATNDIDITAGEASSDASTPTLITLSSGITKRLDASWAVGTGNGGLDTGSIANTTYHVWLIERSDTGVVDALFSTSATSPTMPTNYDRKRRIGSVVRSSATLQPFTQDGDVFLLTNLPHDVDITDLGTTASTLTLGSVPTGISVRADISANGNNGANNYAVTLSALTQADTTPVYAGKCTFYGIANNIAGASLQVRTNTSGQIRARSSVASTLLDITVNGWIDTRGRVS